VQLPCEDHVKYLGLHLDRKLTWQHHIFTKRKHLGVTLTKSNKLLLYKTILKPIWTYGIQLWGTASTSNIQILERFQSKALRMIVDAPWYVPNALILRDLQIPSVKEEISHYSSHYCTPSLSHQNGSACDATCQTICQLNLWHNLCNYNLVLQSTTLPALASQHTIC
jgi:hypothetical protein